MVLIVNPMGNYKVGISVKKEKAEKPVQSVNGKGIGELVSKLKSVKVKHDNLKDIRITL